LPLAIGLLYLILFAFFPGLRQNLFFALFLFSYAATIFIDYQSSLSTDIGQNLFYLRMHRAVNTLFVLFQLRFVYSLFYRDLPKQFWIISLAAFSLGALAVYKPLENFELFGQIVGPAIFIEIWRVIIVSLFKKREGAWIIGLAYLVFVIFGTFDALMDVGIIVPFIEMQNPYAFGSIGFFIAMSVYLSRDFARANKKIVEQEMEQKLLEAENARQSKELEEARQLQLSMLPEELPQLAHLEIAAYMKTATEVGGDYYDFHLADNGTLTVAIGDATGHGMKAGTMVSVIKSLFIAEVSKTDILAFFKKCTQTIKQMRLGNLYMAMMLVRIKDHKMTASSAGIPPIYIYRSETKSVEEIAIKGMPLGGPASLPYKKRETSLAPGDTVLLMSDGFPELFNEKDEMLDYPRVKEIFKETAERSADEIVAHLNEAGERWSHGRPQDDDITFVVLKVKHNIDLQ
jgi:serine phosphatase RsbU (regulator of sigma subunit)